VAVAGPRDRYPRELFFQHPSDSADFLSLAPTFLSLAPENDRKELHCLNKRPGSHWTAPSVPPVPDWQDSGTSPRPTELLVTSQTTPTQPPAMRYPRFLQVVTCHEPRLVDDRERQLPDPSRVLDQPARVAGTPESVADDPGRVRVDRKPVPADRKRFARDLERFLPGRARELGVRERDLIGSSRASVRCCAL